MLFQPDPSTQWKKIQSIGLFPEITSFEKYTSIYLKQLEKASLQNAELGCLVPGVNEVRAAHRFIFGAIHPWAGTFRGPGGVVHFDGGMIGADANRIAPAIKELQSKTLSEIDTALSIPEKVLAIAKYLGALRLIHPFRDGNTRTSVVLLSGQMSALFGPEIRPALASLDFKNMLRSAHQGHLGPLANRMLEEGGLPPLPISATEVQKASPALDASNETEYREHRERILRSQQGKKALPDIPSVPSPGGPPPLPGSDDGNDPSFGGH